MSTKIGICLLITTLLFLSLSIAHEQYEEKELEEDQRQFPYDYLKENKKEEKVEHAKQEWKEKLKKCN